MSLEVRPHTKIFLDSGDPEETRKAIEMLGYLDGQTTNPSLVAKNPEVQDEAFDGEKLTKSELLNEYREIITEISDLIPEGSVSIEVYADENTTAEQMVEQALEMYEWIPNAHIKLPTIKEGLKAEEVLVDMGVRVNMTLVFSQEQAAAVHLAAGRSFEEGDIFVSPFIGRIDDTGSDGMDLIRNIMQMYNVAGSNVDVLVASIRSVEHLIYSFYLEADIVTVPFKILSDWAARGFPMPGVDISEEELQNENEFLSVVRDTVIKDIEYKEIDLKSDWEELDIYHELTEKGLRKFAEDWNNLIVKGQS